MTTIQAIILGLIQGLTEFLPVSSSGHLVLMQNFFGINEGAMTFNILVHFGTLIAIFIVYWKDIVNLIRHPFQKMNFLIIAGAIPTGIIGILFNDTFEKLFSSVLVVGISLIITGFILWFADKTKNNYKAVESTSYLDVLFIGLLQGLAITPGISRSGLTISAGLFRGLTREMAARYSFLLSIPVILGANLLEMKSLISSEIVIENITPYIIGPIVAAISGVLAIKVLLRILQVGKLNIFSYYVWFLGIIVLGRQLFF